MTALKHLARGTMVASLALAGVIHAADKPGRDRVEDSRDRTQQKTANQKTRGDINRGDQHQVQALAEWLAQGNKAEIELSRFAAQRASDPKVKQFAEQMVKEHTQCQQKLEKFTGPGYRSHASADDAEPRTTFNETPKADRKKAVGTDVARNERPDTDDDDAATTRRAGFRGDKHGTMEQIGKAACDARLKLTRELLTEYQGREFDMAYIGQQIASHINMVAQLEAIEKNTTGEFNKVVKEGAKTAREHLQQAKRISTELNTQTRTR